MCIRDRYIEGYSKKNRSRNEKGLDLDRMTWKVKKHFLKKPLQIVCCSDWLASCVRSSALMNSWPVEVIPNPLPISIYKPWPKQNCRELFNLPLDKDLILFGALGGTEDPRKGWKYLKVALKKISFKNNNLHAIIFGQNEPKEKPYDSWTWNTSTGKFEPPIEMPNDEWNYFWDESKQEWIKLNPK